MGAVKIRLLPPEATGWRFSVFIECGKCGPVPCLFVGHAMGWIEAQRKVATYINHPAVYTALPHLNPLR